MRYYVALIGPKNFISKGRCLGTTDGENFSRCGDEENGCRKSLSIPNLDNLCSWMEIEVFKDLKDVYNLPGDCDTSEASRRTQITREFTIQRSSIQFNKQRIILNPSFKAYCS